MTMTDFDQKNRAKEQSHHLGASDHKGKLTNIGADPSKAEDATERAIRRMKRKVRDQEKIG